MTAKAPIWMTRRDYARLQAELGKARHSMRRARFQAIRDLLSSAVIVEDAPGGDTAGPGMILTIRYDTTGDTETFLLGRRGAKGGDIKVYSMASPLGRAIAGARLGEQRVYAKPGGDGLPVTLIEALPYETQLRRRNR